MLPPFHSTASVVAAMSSSTAWDRIPSTHRRTFPSGAAAFGHLVGHIAGQAFRAVFEDGGDKCVLRAKVP